MTKELHLLIIWENGRYKEKEILESLSKNFDIINLYNFRWEKNKFARNLSSFYGSNLPKRSKKEIHCGTGEFLVVTFYDNNPKYEFVETSRGSEKANINVFNIKNQFRMLTGGGHKIHTTNSTEETNHDLTLLFGLNYDDYEKKIKKDYNQKSNKNYVHCISKNIIGTEGWKDFNELLYVMNSSLNYVVLRNFENLLNEDNQNTHGDIDFLVDNLEKAVQITNAKKVFKENYRVHYELMINQKKIYVDFRYIGDDYYDKNWQINILKEKIFFNKNFYIPSNENYFYSLLYHVFFHKIEISPDYPNKLENIFETIFYNSEKKFNFTFCLKLLENFLDRKKYYFVRPKDYSVFFDVKYMNYKDDVEKINSLEVNNVEPFLVDEWKNNSRYLYFVGHNNNQKFFIKSRGIEDSTRKEYRIIKDLISLNNKYFPTPYFYKLDGEKKFIVLSFIEGIRLDKLNFEDKPQNYIDNFNKGMLSILQYLHKLKIVHRDIRPQNFIIKFDGTPILIDFQFAVDVEKKKYKEYKLIRKKPKIIATLGREYLKGRFYWDDAYSFHKIYKDLNISDYNSLQTQYKIQKLINKNVIISVRKNFFSKVIVLIKFYISNIKKKLKV